MTVIEEKGDKINYINIYKSGNKYKNKYTIRIITVLALIMIIK